MLLFYSPLHDKNTGRSYGAKYVNFCLALQTGRPFWAKEKQILLAKHP